MKLGRNRPTPPTTDAPGGAIAPSCVSLTCEGRSSQSFLPPVLHWVNGMPSRAVCSWRTRGQWPDPVSHRIELFRQYGLDELSGWTLDLYDEAAITRMHAAHHGGDGACQPVVRHHAVRSLFRGRRQSSGNRKRSWTGYHNYFLGDDPDQWAGGCLRFNEVRFDDLYPGIDLTMTKGPMASSTTCCWLQVPTSVKW